MTVAGPGLWVRRVTLVLLLGAFLPAGCAAAYLKNGALVSEDYSPRRVLVNYRAKGQIPPDTTYQLVETETGVTILERCEGGRGVLMGMHWKDDAGDHFACWIRRSYALEIVVPDDRSKPAHRYVYNRGTYRVINYHDGLRVVPMARFDPVTLLTPE